MTEQASFYVHAPQVNKSSYLFGPTSVEGLTEPITNETKNVPTFMEYPDSGVFSDGPDIQRRHELSDQAQELIANQGRLFQFLNFLDLDPVNDPTVVLGLGTRTVSRPQGLTPVSIPELIILNTRKNKPADLLALPLPPAVKVISYLTQSLNLTYKPYPTHLARLHETRLYFARKIALTTPLSYTENEAEYVGSSHTAQVIDAILAPFRAYFDTRGSNQHPLSGTKPLSVATRHKIVPCAILHVPNMSPLALQPPIYIQ